MQISSFSSLASTARSTVKALAAAVADAENDIVQNGDQAQPGTDLAVADKKAVVERAKTEVKSEAQPAAKAAEGGSAPKKGLRKGTVLDAYA